MFHSVFMLRCNKLDYSGMKFPLTPTDTVNNCVKYLHKMHCVYARAVQLAIEDRMQSNDKVIKAYFLCEQNTFNLFLVRARFA